MRKCQAFNCHFLPGKEGKGKTERPARGRQPPPSARITDASPTQLASSELRPRGGVTPAGGSRTRGLGSGSEGGGAACFFASPCSGVHSAAFVRGARLQPPW